MLESFPVSLVVGILLGFLAGLGIGGGSLLILWLTVILYFDPSTAKAINLLFFLPSAAASVLFRWRQGYVCWKKLWPGILSGCMASGLCSALSASGPSPLLKKAFGILLLFAGIREVLWKPEAK